MKLPLALVTGAAGRVAAVDDVGRVLGRRGAVIDFVPCGSPRGCRKHGRDLTALPCVCSRVGTKAGAMAFARDPQLAARAVVVVDPEILFESVAGSIAPRADIQCRL